MTGWRLTRRGRGLLTCLILTCLAVIYWGVSNSPDLCLDKRYGYVDCTFLDPSNPDSPNHINYQP